MKQCGLAQRFPVFHSQLQGLRERIRNHHNPSRVRVFVPFTLVDFCTKRFKGFFVFLHEAFRFYWTNLRKHQASSSDVLGSLSSSARRELPSCGLQSRILWINGLGAVKLILSSLQEAKIKIQL